MIPHSTRIDTASTPTSPDYTSASPDYSPASNTESDPSEDLSSDHIPPLPAISPFLSSTDDSSNSDTPDTPPPANEISSGRTTTHSDVSLPDYEVFYFDDDHIKEISSGSTTTHSDISLSEYDSFTFDLSNDQFPSTDRSDFTHEEFADELAHIISPPEYDCELMSILNFGIRENSPSTTCGVSRCLELSVGEEDLLILDVPALKNSSYKGPNRRSNSCCDRTTVSAEGRTICI
nr:hypothetical protein [Tanacetum cinerariifolium]